MGCRQAPHVAALGGRTSASFCSSPPRFPDSPASREPSLRPGGCPPLSRRARAEEERGAEVVRGRFPPRWPRFTPRKPRFAPRKPRFTPRKPRFTPRKRRFTSHKPRFAPHKRRFTPRKPRFMPRKPRFAPRKPRFIPRKPRFAPHKPRFTSRKPHGAKLNFVRGEKKPARRWRSQGDERAECMRSLRRRRPTVT